MPTMSSYELKITGLVKDVPEAPGVGADFQAMFPDPRLPGTPLPAWIPHFIQRNSPGPDKPYEVLVWSVQVEDSPAWTGSDPTGKYIRLDFHAVIGVARPGPLGNHWASGTAQRDLEWFYTYKDNKNWFKPLMGVLNQFNDDHKAALEEEVRVRALQWYCGNGGGP